MISKYRILAIDPAQRTSGYAVLDITQTEVYDTNLEATRTIRLKLIACDSFCSTVKGQKYSEPAGLKFVYNSVSSLIQLYVPNRFSMETDLPKWQTSAKWRMRTDGVIILAAAQNSLKPSEHDVNEVNHFFIGGSRIATGGKSAPKNNRKHSRMKRAEIKPITQQLVQMLFNITVQTTDASDAIAIACNEALCHNCEYRSRCAIRTKGLAYLLQVGCLKFRQIEIS